MVLSSQAGRPGEWTHSTSRRSVGLSPGFAAPGAVALSVTGLRTFPRGGLRWAGLRTTVSPAAQASPRFSRRSPFLVVSETRLKRQNTHGTEHRLGACEASVTSRRKPGELWFQRSPASSVCQLFWGEGVSSSA